jgi:hypothetical protein
MHRTILQSDWFNALYRDGVLEASGKPDYLDAETLAQMYPQAAYYTVPQDVYDQVLDGAGYPAELAKFPLERCDKVR